jgi:hypothetical protein
LEALQQLLLAERHYVPVVELFRGHWGALLLQCGYEACEWRFPQYCGILCDACLCLSEVVCGKTCCGLFTTSASGRKLKILLLFLLCI